MRKLLLLLSLALLGCGENTDPNLVERAAIVANCSANAVINGLEFGSSEYTAFMVTCASEIITNIIIDEVVTPQGLEKL